MKLKTVSTCLLGLKPHRRLVLFCKRQSNFVRIWVPKHSSAGGEHLQSLCPLIISFRTGEIIRFDDVYGDANACRSVRRKRGPREKENVAKKENVSAFCDNLWIHQTTTFLKRNFFYYRNNFFLSCLQFEDSPPLFHHSRSSLCKSKWRFCIHSDNFSFH